MVAPEFQHASAEAKSKQEITATLPTADEEVLKAKSRKISVKEGISYSVSDGMGLRYITPFALSMGATNFHIGLLTSIPSLIGNLSQLYTARIMEKVSRKKITFTFALLQAIMWLFIIGVGILFFQLGVSSKTSLAILIVLYTLLIVFGMMITPAWSSWMKDLVSEKIRGKYFGMRNRALSFVAVSTMLIGGFVLDYFKQNIIFIGFAILFFASFAGRAVSAFLFRKKYEPELKLEQGYYFSIWQFLKHIPASNFGKFVSFLAIVNFAVAISSPLFAVYMLKEIGFSYVRFTIISITVSVSSMIFMPIWGKLGDEYGNLSCIKFTSYFIPAIPLLWCLTAFLKGNPSLTFGFLIGVEILSGLIWSGFNLCTSNFIYDSVSRQKMGLCVAYSNIFNGFGVFFGAMLGGFLASLDFSIYWITPILFVFILSGIARLVVSRLLISRVHEVREGRHFGIKEVSETLSVTIPEQIHLPFHLKILRPRP